MPRSGVQLEYMILTFSQAIMLPLVLLRLDQLDQLWLMAQRNPLLLIALEMGLPLTLLSLP